MNPASNPPPAVKGLTADILRATATTYDISAPPSEWYKREYATPRVAAALLLYKYARLDFDDIARPFSINREDAMRDVHLAQKLTQRVHVFGDALVAITIDALGLDVGAIKGPDLRQIQTMPLV